MLAVVEARCGVPARPPTPLGYLTLLPPAAAPDVSAVVAGGVRWRPDGTATAEAVRERQQNDPEHTWTQEETEAWRP